MMSRPISSFLLPAAVPALAATLAFPAAARASDDTILNDQVRVAMTVERNEMLWPLASLPSLEKGDVVRVKLLTAAGFQTKFPFVANQRVTTMREKHGFIIMMAFVNRGANFGLGPDSFPRPELSPAGDELRFTVPFDAAAPFVFLVPALNDTDSDRAKEFDQIITLCNRDEPIRNFLLRRLGNQADGDLALGKSDPSGPDEVLKKTQFLLPRIGIALRARSAPGFRALPPDQQAEQLYRALGVTPPQNPEGSLTYVDNLLDAFVSNDPNNPVRLPQERQIGDLATTALTFLPGWFNTYLGGLSVLGKVSLLLSRRPPTRDERFFVSANAFPETPDALASRFRIEASEPLFDANPQKKDQRRKNILILPFGRTELARVPIRTTGDGTLYLGETGENRAVSLDSSKPTLAPDQLKTYTSRLSLQLLDGPSPMTIPLIYQPTTGSFLLPADAALPATPVNAVLRGDWGHQGDTVEVSQRFRLAGVRPQRWNAENIDGLVAGQSSEIRLRSATIARPAKVTLRLRNGDAIDAREIVDVRGAFVARFDLTGKRAGIGRIEVYQSGLTAPDLVESGADSTGAPLAVAIYDPLRAPSLADIRFYAADKRLLLKRGALPDSALPTKIELGGAIYEPLDDTGDDFLAFATAGDAAVLPVGVADAKLSLRDGRRMNAGVRVRPRRPSLTSLDMRPLSIAPIPFSLPNGTVAQHAPIEITLVAATGYTFSRTTRLSIGNLSLSPDPIITSSQGANSARFLLDPQTQRSLRGTLAFRLTEERDNAEIVSSDETFLPLRLIDLPEGNFTLEWLGGRYRLRGGRLDVVRAAGSINPSGDAPGGALEPVMPTALGNGLFQIEFRAAPGEPIGFALRDGDLRLNWTGAIVPASVAAAPTTELENGAVRVKWTGAKGATGYRIYRDTTADFTPSAQNRVAEVSGASTLSALDGKPLAPGQSVFYKVVAFHRSDTFPAEFESTVSPASAPLTIP